MVRDANFVQAQADGVFDDVFHRIDGVVAELRVYMIVRKHAAYPPFSGHMYQSKTLFSAHLPLWYRHRKQISRATQSTLQPIQMPHRPTDV